MRTRDRWIRAPGPAAVDPSLLAEGTDGCGEGWSSPPKGRPLKTTNATKRRTAAERHGSPLDPDAPKDLPRQQSQLRAVHHRSAVSAAAAEPKPYRPPPKSCSVVNRSCAANHVTAAPARPYRFVR